MLTLRNSSLAVLVYHVGNGAGVNTYAPPSLTPAGSPVDYSQSSLKVYKQDATNETLTELYETTDYTFDGSGNVVTNSDNVAGDVILIERVTDADVAKVVYTAPFEVSTPKLNKSSSQWYLLIQEILSLIYYCLKLTVSATRGLVYDFGNRCGINLADPEEDTDAVNLRTMNTALAELSNAFGSLLAVSGLSWTSVDTLPDGDNSFTIAGGFDRLLLFIAGETYFIDESSGVYSGTTVETSGDNKIVTLPTPYYNPSGTNYIALVFNNEA